MNNRKELSRIKKNRVCRQILSSFNIDLNYISLQSTIKSLHISGKLQKTNKQPCTPEEIGLLLERLKVVTKRITTDLENWDLNGWQVKKINKLTINHEFNPLKKDKKKKKKKEIDIIIDLS